MAARMVAAVNPAAAAASRPLAVLSEELPHIGDERPPPAPVTARALRGDPLQPLAARAAAAEDQLMRVVPAAASLVFWSAPAAF